ADDLVAMAQLVMQKEIFFFQAPLLNGVTHQHNDFLKRKRFLDEIESAKLGGAHRGLDGAVARDHDDGGRVRQRLNAAEGFEAVHAGQPDVEKRDFQIAKRAALQSLFGGSNGVHLIALVFENQRERLADAGFIVDDQNVGARRHKAALDPLWSATVADVKSATGSSMTKREPTGKLSSTWMLPPCSAMIRAAIASPRPVPRSLVEKWGRKSLSLSSGEIPRPVSATEISTASASASALVETAISRKEEFSRASAALSMRFTTTLRSRPASARTMGRLSVKFVLSEVPSSLPEKTSTASWTIRLALAGASLAAGKRTNWENSLTKEASVETSRSIKREHS